ncbi:MAG TPA: F0F1 ATP synthase subunit B [Clostridiales bacterium]|nr:F0F1 ATP synthase subunit B [Clostridiales bacterium]
MISINAANLIFNMVNIIILFVFFRLFLFKPVNNILEKRKRLIEDSLQDADDKKAEAYQLKAGYEAELKQAGDQAGSIIKEARERAEVEYNRILQEARQESAKVMEEANRMIEFERKKSIENAQAEVAGIAMLAAAKVIGKNVDDSTNRQFLDDFLKEVGAAK